MLAAYLSVCLLAGSGQPPASEPKPAPPDRVTPAKETKPLKVADVVKGLGLDEAKVEYIDEPPGCLAKLYWSKVKLPGTEVAVDVEVVIVFTSALFSETRTWDIKKLRDVTVLKVTISPHRKVD